jgi:hypothetical protein
LSGADTVHAHAHTLHTGGHLVTCSGTEVRVWDYSIAVQDPYSTTCSATVATATTTGSVVSAAGSSCSGAPPQGSLLQEIVHTGAAFTCLACSSSSSSSGSSNSSTTTNGSFSKNGYQSGSYKSALLYGGCADGTVVQLPLAGPRKTGTNSVVNSRHGSVATGSSSLFDASTVYDAGSKGGHAAQFCDDALYDYTAEDSAADDFDLVAEYKSIQLAAVEPFEHKGA